MTDADLLALTVLSEGPAHGHGIWSRLAECDVEDWAAVSRAQVYYSLGKLAAQSLIRPARAVNAETRRESRTWRITPAGRRALTAAMSSSHWAKQRAVPPFLTWVALSEHARPAVRGQTLAARRTFLEAEIARERETLAALQRRPADTRGMRLTVSMVEHVIRQMTLELDWLQELEGVLAD